ncbi:hypothetical protein H072_5554 [Dactylellina haptotyla CBS 200.50]|uniref:Uncharacterized protein n=1 Tax=Dactylellina haptotyla (strain CBS 200.50) TaxID=1284197 RepID=S8ACD3_DACHA|nr:hypothetical protein H072_5554 [Dactylellina haptotyla CBS 200.50]
MSLFSPPSSPSAPSNGFINLNLNLPSPASPSSPYNLRKRKADVEPTVESPLTKRFRKLNLRNTLVGPASKVTKRTSSPARNSLFSHSNTSNSALSAVNNIHNAATNAEPWSLTPPPFQRPSSPPPAAMDMDDTPYRIYVNDLDSSSDESDLDPPHKQNGKNATNPIIFLSDVEREMSRIPLAVLKGSPIQASPSGVQMKTLPTARSGTGSSTDLILYRPPEKIVDDGGVNRLIMEARERIRSRNSGSGSTMEGISSTATAVPTPAVDTMMDQGMGHLGQGLTDSPMSFTPVTMMNNDPDAMVLDDL